MTKLTVLDSLFASLDVEQETAAARGARLERWDGDPRSLADADAVAHVRTHINGELISSMRRCRVISRFGSGIDTVDLAAAEAAGIAVVTVRDYCVPELPTHTLALAFALLRRLTSTAGALDRGWNEIAESVPISRYHRATVIGLGSVGRRVAAALVALGYAVSAVTGHSREEAIHLGAEVVPLDEGLARADVVFLHASLDAGSRNLVNAQRLQLMRPEAILVNTARLGLMDEAAVADALETGRLAGLALDARLAPESPLRKLIADPRVLITPHVGWYSEEAAELLRRAAIENALAVLLGRQDSRVSQQ
jgi:D-3-phosphoglycerate dehydrogenase